MPTRRRPWVLTVRRASHDGFWVLPAAAFAVLCCAGLPLVATVLSGLAVGAVLGVAAAIVVVAAGVVASLVARRRRSSGNGTS